jgi:hypothetical protein
MTETTALLRAIHYDVVAVIGFLVALHDKGGVTAGTSIDAACEATLNARKYYDMAAELAEEAANDAQ